MEDRIHSKRQVGLSRARLLGAAVLVSGLLVAACGGSAHTPAAATIGGASSPGSNTAANAAATTTAASRTATSGASGASGSGAQGAGGAALAFAMCMRANGVPNFPDPEPGGGLLFPVTAGVNPSAPAFEAAQAKCVKLLPGGGPPVPGSTTHPSAQTLSKLVRIARCMRQHGVPQFPDPQTSVPSRPFGSGEGVITDFDGAILLFPSTLNMQSPAYKQATEACGALAEKLGRGPH